MPCLLRKCLDLNAIMYFIELGVNQGSETLISTDRGLAPRLSSARESSLPRCPFLDSFGFADHPTRNLLDHLSLSLTQQAELHQKWQILTWKAARNSGS